MPSPARFGPAHLALLASCGVGACAPNTDLVGEGGGSTGSPGGATASTASLVDPAPGTAGVPLNLASVLVRFPLAVTVPDGALTISGGGQRAGAGVPVVASCPEVGPGSCFRVVLAELLMPSATYVVAIGEGVVDANGRPISAGPVGQFVTAEKPDLVAPAIAALVVVPSGPCVLVSFQTDEPAAATVIMRAGGIEEDVPAGAGSNQFAASASVAAFGAGANVQVVVRVADLAGNVAESAAVAVSVPAGLLPLAITEVHANPLGPEPAQEFVEIRNLGQLPVEVAGLLFEDSKGSDTLPAMLLDPGVYALIVPSSFDIASPVDTAPRATAPLLRVDTRLGADGLSNGGETVRLRSGDGTIVSSYGAVVDVSASKWAGKSVHRVPEDACDQSASWTRLPTEATPGWGAP